MFPSFNKNKNQHNQRINTQTTQKSFHIEKQTFYHHYFKKIKPTQFHLKSNHQKSYRNQQNSFKQNIPKSHPNIVNYSTSYEWKKLYNNSERDHNKIIQKVMKNKKTSFSRQINQSLSKINNSFNRYINGKTSQQDKLLLQRKKTVSCKNILKELKQMHSMKLFNLPLVNLNQKNLLEMAAQNNYQISNLQSHCLDSLFPFQRYGPAITSYQNQILLYGGFNLGKKSNVSCFHKYNFDKKLWTKVQQTSKPLSMIPCFHTIDVYKNYMILVGGISISPQCGGKRKFNSDICIFNFEKKEWIKLRASLAIRSHASTLFGNTLLIHGGIDQKQNNSNQMHFINFNAFSIQNSLILSTQNRQYSIAHKHNLSHHKIVNTNQVDTNLKMLLKYDGVLCFGGVNNQGEMHNEITFLNCIGKQNALDVRFQSWIPVQQLGRGARPQARKNHSLNVINKKALMLLIGGQNILGQILNDIWVFDLVKLQWRQINPITQPINKILTDNHYIKQLRLQEGISGHCTTFLGSKLIIFGGRKSIQNKKQNCLWQIQTQIVNNINKKIKIDKSSNTSINTIKDSNKQESMWNIQF